MYLDIILCIYWYKINCKTYLNGTVKPKNNNIGTGNNAELT